MCIVKHHKIKNRRVKGFTPTHDEVLDHVTSLHWMLQIQSGEILQVCPEKQELNPNAPYLDSYLTKSNRCVS
jgi:hypothetical protein